MGRLLFVFRIAVKDIRHRPVQAILLLLAIATGAATLTLGLALRGTTDHPYARTRAATNGPDVVAVAFPNGSNAPGPATSVGPGGSGAFGSPGGPASANVGGLMRLEHAPGVSAYSGTFPMTWALLRMGQTTATAKIEGPCANVRRPAEATAGQLGPPRRSGRRASIRERARTACR